MIDIENEIFTVVAAATRARFSGITVAGEYVKSPASFPFVSLVEADNTVLRSTQSSSDMENHVEVMYEVNIYSNKKSGKKTECKGIAEFIDDRLLSLGFSRMILTPIPNMDDATIYRISGRYKAIVSKNKTIYRR